MNKLLPYLVDVPVRVNIWIRPDCQSKQFEILKQARPSVLFLQSDGGRNEIEWEAIRRNRKLFEEEINWECRVYRFYEEHNLGLYTMGKKVATNIWQYVDRCIFLEDDQIPSVSFFYFCAELLEKYKNDERVEMICGHNVMEHYSDAEPYDYFFTEVGWSIWGTARWKEKSLDWDFPLDYATNDYIKRCLKDNLTPFWYKKVEGYATGNLHDNHVPGAEYFHGVNSVLHHRLSIVPTRNMICNIGLIGEHSNQTKRNCFKLSSVFNLKTYELELPIKHPKYIIDDSRFGKRYERILHHDIKTVRHFLMRLLYFIELILRGDLIRVMRRKFRRKIEN